MSAETLSGNITPSTLPTPVRWRIFGYLSLLVALVSFGMPFQGLIDVPISFFLKNKLHLTAHQVADFRLVAAIPLYLGFVFGFIRDSWSPFGMGDRGYLVLFGAICAAICAGFAFTPVSYGSLLLAVILLTSAFQFVYSAQNGLTAVMGQQHAMSGQISALWNAVGMVPVLTSYFLGGVLSQNFEGRNADPAARTLFLIGAGIMILTALYGLWRPKVVFDNLHSEHRRGDSIRADVGRLLRHRPIYPALLIWLMWNFAPGGQTPLQYYLQNTLHASDADFGAWFAIFVGSFIPTFLLYGVLCRKFKLRALLWWGTIFAVPQFVPLLFLHNVTESLIAAAPIGLMGGVASAAYIDLLIRSCPRGLQATLLMMSWGLYFISSRFGDVLGTYIYDHYRSFTPCVIAITTVYALILPLLLWVPKNLTATKDGEIPKEGSWN